MKVDIVGMLIFFLIIILFSIAVKIIEFLFAALSVVGTIGGFYLIIKSFFKND